jgi:hypothetical protein
MTDYTVDPACEGMTSDAYGTERSVFDPSAVRFGVQVIGHEPDEEPGWRYKLRVIDLKYNDSDGYPIDAIAGGDSWPEAFTRAGNMVEQALANERCIF